MDSKKKNLLILKTKNNIINNTQNTTYLSKELMAINFIDFISIISEIFELNLRFIGSPDFYSTFHLVKIL